MKHNVFYSWQSDLPNSTNRGFIQGALEGAAEDLKQDDELNVEPVIDRDTSGVAGSPDIGQTIFSKIESAAAFVCDVSIINSASGQDRPTPNPNVLIELGYALKTLGPSRIIMVMNTAHGTPEKLPFDLKQKRVTTYSQSETTTDKPAQKKSLRGQLKAAMKAVLAEYKKQAEVPPPALPSIAETTIEAIKNGRPDQAKLARAYMASIGKQLQTLDPHTLAGEADENLVNAINATVPLVKEFDRVADEIASMNASEAARALYKGFENILTHYFLPARFSGSYKNIDFDFFKFVGHELFVILFAHLLKQERWDLIIKLLNEQFQVPNLPNGEAGLVPFWHLAAHVALLDVVRNKRLATGGTRRISIHADLLKERHDNAPLSESLTWPEFMEADAFLFIRSFKGSEDFYWFPRTYVYLGSFKPRFLLEATSASGADRLKKLMGVNGTPELQQLIREAVVRLSRGARDADFFRAPFDNFDPSKIAE